MAKITGQDGHVVTVDDQIEQPMRERDEREHDGAALAPSHTTSETKHRGKYQCTDYGVRVIGMDDVFAIPTMKASNRLQRLKFHEKHWDEDDIEPHCPQHQGPKGNPRFAGLGKSGKTEM